MLISFAIFTYSRDGAFGVFSIRIHIVKLMNKNFITKRPRSSMKIDRKHTNIMQIGTEEIENPFCFGNS